MSSRLASWSWLSFVLVSFCIAVVPVWAQTPLDPLFLQLRASTVIWTSTLIVIAGIIMALLLMSGVHIGPQVFLMIVFGFMGIWLMGLAASGQLGAWVGIGG